MAEHAAGLATEKEARDVAEAARESEWSGPSFVRELFLGRFRLDLIHPHPVKSDPAEEARAKAFFAKLRAFLERVDSDMIDRTGEIPESYVQELREMGAFGIKIPTEYGGLGLSYASYTRAMAMVTSKDGSLTALLSASQSIGLPQPLKLFGTAEQKQRFFPRLAKGAISAFALTEVDAGSDPANLRTSATMSEDGKFWTLNGEKLWCTNGTRADLLVVMARTPDATTNGRSRKANYRVHRRGQGAGRGDRAPLPVHGAQGDRERRAALHQRACAVREHPLGRGQGAQARAHHAEHRPPHPAGELRRRGQGNAPGGAPLGERARAVGTADREARGDRAEDRPHGGQHLRDGGGGRADGRSLGARSLRHPARGGDRQDVEHGDRLEDRGRHAPDPRRSRLRDGGLAARARRGGHSCRTRDARLPHQPDLRGDVGGDAAVHRPRGGGPPLQDGVRPRRQGVDPEGEGLRARPRHEVLSALVSRRAGSARATCRWRTANSASSAGTCGGRSATRVTSGACSFTPWHASAPSSSVARWCSSAAWTSGRICSR